MQLSALRQLWVVEQPVRSYRRDGSLIMLLPPRPLRRLARLARRRRAHIDSRAVLLAGGCQYIYGGGPILLAGEHAHVRRRGGRRSVRVVVGHLRSSRLRGCAAD